MGHVSLYAAQESNKVFKFSYLKIVLIFIPMTSNFFSKLSKILSNVGMKQKFRKTVTNIRCIYIIGKNIRYGHSVLSAAAVTE